MQTMKYLKEENVLHPVTRPHSLKAKYRCTLCPHQSVMISCKEGGWVSELTKQFFSPGQDFRKCEIWSWSLGTCHHGEAEKSRQDICSVQEHRVHTNHKLPPGTERCGLGMAGSLPGRQRLTRLQSTQEQLRPPPKCPVAEGSASHQWVNKLYGAPSPSS